jgi:signal peptidase I
MSDPAENRPPSPLARLFRTLAVGRRPKWTLIRILSLVLIVWIIVTFVVLPVRVVGVSMFPTFKEDEFHCINRLAYLRGEPQRFDVVAVRVIEGGPILLKRIVGLPGEVVSVRRGTVHINGEPLEEPYVRARLHRWHDHDTKLEADQYLVIGDNRSTEPGMHSHGVCHRRYIVGKLLF